MILITVNFYPSAKHKEDFVLAFNKLAEASRKEDGCITYDIYPKGDGSSEFFLLEKWESKAKLDAHGKSAHFVEFMNAPKEWYEKETKITVYNAKEIE
ncbi:putative quinol monooxygenase [Saccharicrinis fermentans]|uniref:Putative monooxygenase YcnE n=1 Tax=Saccharicrinis fermentans DSM 9555 = JCM 21142 TaxID=869213 RepID=W7Y4H6_9BACT|nr:putative quinol monooxygenase [Saccharicrinis fermentans]GAF03007.1 putative monooxygenase YcnE [Saccharicrinis fermentans DSM 9555 = JCM 21142]